jgi:N-acetylmuramic acid 6-phosphate etherase
MIYVALTNQKLRRRGERILMEATGASPSAAEHALRKAGHNLPVALIMLKTNAQLHDAERSLAKSGGNITQALRAARSLPFNTKRRGK